MMDDEKGNAGKSGSAADGNDEELELEVDGETEDKEELYDKDGKPLPWNKSPRFRKLYGEAKEGRKLSESLKELGLKTSDLPRLREEMGRLQQYDRAYAQYLEAQKKGETDDDDDEGAREVQKQTKRLKAQLKSLGVKMVEDEEEEHQTQAKSLENRKQEVVGRARDRISELLEDAGVDLKGMEKIDRKELMEEFDFKIGQRLARDEESRAAFMRGSLRPIEKYFKEIAAKVNLPVKKSGMKSSGISQLPPRMSSSHPGSPVRKQQAGAPKTVRDVTEEIVADLKARNATRRAEQE
jgi:hypothetical protein